MAVEREPDTGVAPAQGTSDPRLARMAAAAAVRRGEPPPPPPPAAEEAPAAGEESAEAAPAAAATSGEAQPASDAAAASEQPASEQAAAEGEEPMARSWADITRRDRELRASETQLQEGRRAAQELARLRQAAAQDPLAVLQHLGVHRGTVLDRLIEQGGDEAEQQGKQPRLSDIQAELRRTQEQLANTKVEGREQAKIRGLIEHSNAEMTKTALRHSDEVVDDVLAEAAAEWQRSGGTRRPDYGACLERVEARYFSESMGLIENLLSVTKVREQVAAKLAPASPGKTTEPAKTTSPSTGARKEPPKTLTNDLQEEAPPHRETKRLSQQEARDAFLSFVRGKWQKAKENDR